MPLKDEGPVLIATRLTVFESWVGWVKFQWTRFTIWLFNGLRYIYFKILQLIAWAKLIAPPIKPEGITSINKRQKILDSISLNVYAGEIVAIMGSSGSGKSTLLKLLSGQMAPFPGGNVVIKNLDSRIAEQPGRVIGYLHQDDILHIELSLQDALNYSARLRHPDASTTDLKNYVNSVMSSTQINHRSRYSIGTLSGGERRRANLSAELLSGSSFLFLDEPTANLDPYHSREIIKLIKENVVGAERAVILSTHDVWNYDLYDKIVFIFEGKMIFCGTPNESIEFFNKYKFPPEKDSQDTIKNLADIYAIFEGVKDDKKRFALVSHYESEWQIVNSIVTNHTENRRGDFYEKKLWKMWRISIMAKVRQFVTLSKRFVTCYLTDMLFLLVLQPIIASGLIFLFLKPEYLIPETGNFGKLQIASFLLVIIASMMGLVNSHREIVRERTILSQEQRAGIGTGSYIFSKISVLYLISLIQASIISLLINYQIGSPGGLVFESMGMEIFISTFLCMVVNINIGLLISLISKTTGQATNMLVPALATELVVLTSIAFQRFNDIPGLDIAGKIIPTGWAYESIGIAFNLNGLTKWNENVALAHLGENLLWKWVFLIILCAGYGLITIMLLWFQKKSLEPKHILLELDKVNVLPYFGERKTPTD
jgi:ABC-type multidrug transport system ATPase subunit